MIKRVSSLILIITIALIAFTLYSLKPTDEITAVTTKTETQTRTDYVDGRGKLVNRSGYSTLIRTFEDEKPVLEEYYDNKGRPSTLSSGYSKVKRLYKDDLNTVIIYLDADGVPLVTKNGYDSIRRAYYSSGKADTDTYYIGDRQVRGNEGYWQYKRVYNAAGKLSEGWYLDRDGDPIASSLGQYGFHREYDDDGRVASVTYLDALGQPMNTNRGYSTIRYSYEDSGTKTLYYDVDGRPVTIGRNQYGILKSDGKGYYLDEDGEVMHRLDNVLNTHPWVVLVCGLILMIIAVFLRGRLRTGFLVIYVLFVLYMTMVYREPGESSAVFELFASYREFFRSPTTRQNILNNIWLFVPLGAALYDPEQRGRWLWAVASDGSGLRCRWLWAIALSIVIESVQWFTGIGLCEVDDVISNSLGALIGYGVAGTMGRWWTGMERTAVLD